MTQPVPDGTSGSANDSPLGFFRVNSCISWLGDRQDLIYLYLGIFGLIVIS